MALKTRPKRIHIDAAVMSGIEKHAISNLTAEVGGMLFGSTENGQTTIDGFVPATNAKAEQISLTFTHEVWSDILAEGEKYFPGKQIVGWYHTHPSFGIFLSDYDQFIQQNFFTAPGQLALVLDPILGNMGWFENKGKRVTLVAEEAMKVGPQSKPSTDNGGKKGPLPYIFTALVTAAVASAVSTGLVLATTPPNLAQALADERLRSESLSGEIASLQGQLGYIDGALSLQYKIHEGDTFESISMIFFGNSSFASQIAEKNQMDASDPLEIGSWLQIVAPTEIELLDTPLPETSGSPTPSPSPAVESTPSPSPSGESKE